MSQKYSPVEKIYELSNGEDARDVAREIYQQTRKLGFVEEVLRRIDGRKPPKSLKEVMQQIEAEFPGSADRVKIRDTLVDVRLEHEKGFTESEESRMARARRRDDRYHAYERLEDSGLPDHLAQHIQTRAQEVVSEEAMQRYHTETQQGHTEWRKRFESESDKDAPEADKKDEGMLLH